jgi:hypothetical protein
MMNAQRLRRHFNRETLLHSLPVPAWIVATACTVTMLVWRPAMPWITAAAALGAIIWLWLAVRRHGWSEADAAIRLDRLAGAGGLLLTVGEVPSPQWESKAQALLTGVKPPPMLVTRPLLLTAGAVAFGAAAFVAPTPQPLVRPGQEAALREVQKLEAEAEALQKEDVAPREWTREIERLRAEAEDARFDASDWEAADSLKEAAAATAQARTDDLQSAEDATARLEEALNNHASDEQVARERESLESALAALSPHAGLSDGNSQEHGAADASPQSGDHGETAGTSGTASRQPQAGGEQASEQSGKSGAEGRQAQGGSKEGSSERAGAEGKGSPEGRSGSEQASSQRGNEGGSEGRGSESKSGEGSKSGSAEGKDSSQGQPSGAQASNQPVGKDGAAGTGKPGHGQSAGDLKALRQTLQKRREQLAQKFPGAGQRGSPQSGPPTDGIAREDHGTDQHSRSDSPEGSGGNGRGWAPPAPHRFGEETQVQEDRLRLVQLNHSKKGHEPGELWGLVSARPSQTQDAPVSAPSGHGAGDETAPGPRGGPVPPRFRDLVQRYFGGSANSSGG